MSSRRRRAQQLLLGEHVGPEQSIERDFRAFDDQNPEVYRELVRLARVWVKRRGLTGLGVATLYEVTRWELARRMDWPLGDDLLKLNNNHRALYARKIMEHETDLAGLFKTRKLAPVCRCSRCVL